MNTLKKKLVVSETGQPLEVIIPWDQFCEMQEALGLDLDDCARTDLIEARRDWDAGREEEFVPLSSLR